MMVENCAESAITAIPQISERANNKSGCLNTSAATRQHAALTAIAIMVTRARWPTRIESDLSCRRSLAIPAQIQPTAPIAIASAAALSYCFFDHPFEEAKITAIHPH